jgi:hypothetical protein
MLKVAGLIPKLRESSVSHIRYFGYHRGLSKPQCWIVR